jgi:hypothetical protein
MVSLDIAPGTTDHDADGFVSTAPDLLKHTWRWRNIRFDTDALVAKPNLLIFVPLTAHLCAEARRGLLHDWGHRRQRLGQPHVNRKGTRLASERFKQLKRHLLCGGVGGIPDWFGRTVCRRTPLLC